MISSPPPGTGAPARVAWRGRIVPLALPLDRVALRETWRALWLSRALVWAAGAGTVATLGFGPARHAFDAAGMTRGLGHLGAVLAAPAARWDAAWYLAIAHFGYRPDLGAFSAGRSAFFPLYPLALRGLSDLGAAPILAGVLVSTAALAGGLYGLHRLSLLEAERLKIADPEGCARRAVLLTALAPMALFFSAVYSESLYLALSVGAFLCARRGRWAAASGLAALAAATRSTGVLLVVPLAILYLYGPRADREPDRLRMDSLRGMLPRRRLRTDSLPGVLPRLRARTDSLRGLLPRYRLRRDAGWIALAPLGLGLYMAYLWGAGGDPFSPFHAQAVWGRSFGGPLGGAWDGTKAAFDGARELLWPHSHALGAGLGGASPTVAAGHDVVLFGFLAFGAVATVGVLRLLPAAYGAYVLAALALPLSYPVASQPLMSLPRFLLVLFPLNIWLAVRLGARPRVARVALVASAALMALFAADFATWHWVA